MGLAVTLGMIVAALQDVEATQRRLAEAVHAALEHLPRTTTEVEALAIELATIERETAAHLQRFNSTNYEDSPEVRAEWSELLRRKEDAVRALAAYGNALVANRDSETRKAASAA